MTSLSPPLSVASGHVSSYGEYFRRAAGLGPGRRSPATTCQERRHDAGNHSAGYLILLLVGAIPTWPHSRSWGYGPSGGLGLVLLILIILFLLGKI
jgi:Protein of unknown function (DUF3309)